MPLYDMTGSFYDKGDISFFPRDFVSLLYMVRYLARWGWIAGFLMVLPVRGQEFPTGPLTVRFSEEEGFVAFDREGERRFVVFPFDNGPDYPSEGLFRIVDGGRIGFADTTGRVVIPPRFSAVLPFHQGRAAFCTGCTTVREGEHSRWQGGKWGFIDRQGRVVVPAMYEALVKDFRDGRAVVVTRGDTVAIDHSGNVIPVHDLLK
jgi:hypothetical protein